MKKWAWVDKLKRLILFLLVFSLFINCASLTPKAIEDWDEGTVLIIDSSKVLKVIQNWGLENGYQYVAYRRLPSGTSNTSEWAAAATQYGAFAESETKYTSQVLVMGIDDPKNAPDKFSVAEVPSEPHLELTKGGGLALCILGGVLLGLMPLLFIL
jgi:hypothetical protein